MYRKPMGRQNSPYPRSEAIAINNTGADLTSSDIGKVVALDWTPSGTNLSAIALTQTNQAKFRKALVLSAGLQSAKINVLLQGEDSALLPNTAVKGDVFVAIGSTNSGATAVSAIAATALTGGIVGTSSAVTPISSIATALAANATTGTLISTPVFFDGQSTAVTAVKRDGA